MPRLRVPVTDRDHQRGPARASVTLVEYGDFQCPFCRQAFYALRNIEDRFQNDLRLVYRHFPLAEIHPLALIAAEASEAAGAQGRFWEMHDTLFQNQPNFQPEELIGYASQLGLDVDAFTEDLMALRHRDRIREDFMGGVRSGVNGTPSLFINGELFDAPAEERLLARAIEAARRGWQGAAVPQ
ncbi:MAG TPA: DsbA family protein [Kofleriaceae bacterium]